MARKSRAHPPYPGGGTLANEFRGLQEALKSRYRIETIDSEPRVLGQGGMATVFLARDLKHDRYVALKVIRPGLAAVLGPDLRRPAGREPRPSPGLTA